MANEKQNTHTQTHKHTRCVLNKKQIYTEEKKLLNKRAMQIYFKTIYFVLSGYLQWFRFRKRMWMSTRSMAIYVARFCDHLFTLSSVRLFIQFIHIFVGSLVGLFARICTFVATILFFVFDFSHALAWNWHKTWTVLFICLLLFFLKNRQDTVPNIGDSISICLLFFHFSFTSLVHTKRVLNHSLPEFPFRSQLFSTRIGCLNHRFNTVWMPFFILCQTLTLYVYV